MKKTIHLVFLKLMIFTVLLAAGYAEGEFKWLVNPRFVNAGSFSGGMAAVSDGKKWGYISSRGELLLDFVYDEAGDFYDGTAPVYINGMRGAVNLKGMPVILPGEDSGRYFGDGIAVIKTEGKYGYIRRDGIPLINPVYEDAISFSEGVAPVKINGRYGYINMKGGIVINPQFEKGSIFSEGLAAVSINGKWGYINRRGTFAVKTAYLDGGDFSSGYAHVRTEAGYGYINKKGLMVITPQFEDAKPFSENAAAVKSRGLWGYIRMPGLVKGGGRLKSPDKHDKEKEKVNHVLKGVENEDKGGAAVKNSMESAGGESSGKSKGVKTNGAGSENIEFLQGETETVDAVPEIKGMEYAGTVSEVNEGQVVVREHLTGVKVFLGAWCIVTVEGNNVILDSGTPISTVARCDPRDGFLEKIRPGMRVYKKIK